MNASELLRRIVAAGGDDRGIRDRFVGNDELYLNCFLDFLEEPNFTALDVALAAGDYEGAFSAAHALKGLSGNLGVTRFYEAICTLVESLRAQDYGPVAAEYAQVLRQLQSLRALAELPVPTAEAPAGAAAEPPPSAAASMARPQARRDRFIPLSLTVLALIICCVGFLFIRMLTGYNDNVARESAKHLTEINEQLKLYMEQRIENDWRVAHSVGDSIAENRYQDDDAAVFDMLVRKREVWNVTDIKLYTESGYCVCSDGTVETNDVASDTIDRARKAGEYLSVVNSALIYTVPVETELNYNGARVVAVSVVQSMSSFLDNMEFSSFGGTAWMYLTEENGMVVSRLSSASSLPVFNFLAVTEGSTLTPLNSEQPEAALMTVQSPTTFLMSGQGEETYVVATPIATHGAPMRLFYLAPVSVVNETMNQFAQRLLLLSLIVIVIFAVLAFLLFLLIYRNRTKRFDKALLARERTFDLLVQNSQTAFGLFSVNQPEPVYVSRNAAAIIGDRYFALDRGEDGLRIRNSSGTETEAVRRINDKMRGWDGTGEFRSGFILNDRAVPPAYFELQLFPADGAGMDFVGIARDVTQAYERERTAREALEMAERANEAKSRFLSNMSHDIRTPMNAIVNMAGFALESLDRPKKLGEYLQTIRESSDHLLRLINDVLDMSRIESGQTVIGSEPFDLRAEMARQVDIIRPLCAVKHQTLLADFDGVHTSTVCGDQMKFSQIIMNLLSNAVKFTPENGAVRFTAAEIPSLRENIVDLRIMIEDNGIGIAPDYIQRIFEPFSRADDRRVSRIEGTGLGLSICHSYVTAMGGTIQCESEAGEGSVFTVELFFEKTEEVLSALPDPSLLGKQPFLGLRCLICEDNAINQTIAVTMLERLGFLTEIAADGGESVKKFLHSQPGTYDVIFMDIQMPVMDGYRATVTIRESNHPQAASIPIVAMTANVFAEDIEKARIAGMDGYLGKPLMSINLVEETDKAIRKRKGERI